MANKLASTVFSSGPKDSLAATDVYTASGKAIINSIQALSLSTGIDVSGILGNKLSSSLGNVLSLAANGLKINKDTLISRLISTNSNITTAFKALSSSVTDQMTKSMNESKTFIESNINGVKGMVDSTNFDSLSSIGTFINDYKNTDIFSIEDTGAVSSLLGGIVTEGCNLGMKNVFSSLTEGITDDVMVSKIIDSSITSAIANSDLDTLTDITSSSAGKYINDKYPDLSSKLIESYANSEFNEDGLTTESDQFVKLINVLNNINSSWSTLSRQGGADLAVNLAKIMGGSKDFINLVSVGVKALTDTNDSKKYMALQSAYSKTTVEASIKRYFPKLVLDSSNSGNKDSTTKNSNKKPIDPRLIKDAVKITTVLLS